MIALLTSTIVPALVITRFNALLADSTRCVEAMLRVWSPG